MLRRTLPEAMVIAALCLVWLFCLISIPAEADGGAPNLAYVAGTPQGVSVIDIAQQRVKDRLSIAGNPQTILLSVDGRLLYVTQPALQRIAVIATATKATVCTAAYPGHPTLLTLDPGTNLLYVAGLDAKVVEAIDPYTCAIRHTVITSTFVTGIAIAVVGSGLLGGNGNQLWVATTLALSIYDGTGKPLAIVPMLDGPRYLCIPSGPTAYVTTRQGTVDAVDLQSHHMYAGLIRGGSFGPMDYNATNGEIFVPDMVQHRIAVLTPIDTGNGSVPHEPIRVIPLAAAPQSIAITSDGQLGFVAVADGTVVMLDIPGRQIATTFHVGGHPSFIVTGLYPLTTSLTPQQSFFFNTLSTLSHYVAALVILVATIVLLLVNRWKIRRARHY